MPPQLHAAAPSQDKKTARPRLLARSLCLCVLSTIFSAAPVRAQQQSTAPAFAISTGTPLLAYTTSTGAVVGQGGNYSIQLKDGRSLWLLNNVMTGEFRPDGQPAVWDIVDGAAAFSASTSPYAQAGALRCVSDDAGLPLPLLSGLAEAPGRRFWPRSGLCAAGKCYVFFSVMNNFGPELYDYFRVGQGVAYSENPAGPYRKTLGGSRYSLWNDVEPAFGSAVLADADGWVYVYGRVMTAPGEYAAALARVKPDRLAAREKYEYYGAAASSGPWTGDLAEASTFLEGVPEDFSVSYNDHLKSYLAVYLDQETGSTVARQGRSAWGPWGEPFTLLTCAPGEYCFGAREQAGYALEGGRKIFLTVERKNAPYLYEITFK